MARKKLEGVELPWRLKGGEWQCRIPGLRMWLTRWGDKWDWNIRPTWKCVGGSSWYSPGELDSEELAVLDCEKFLTRLGVLDG